MNSDPRHQYDSADDLWKLFWEGELPEDGPNRPGNRAVEFPKLHGLVKSLRFPLESEIRSYYLFSVPTIIDYDVARVPNHEAVVSERRVVSVGRALEGYLGTRKSRTTELFVLFLGHH